MAIYAVAMGYLEGAAVLYLRTIYGGIDPVGPRHSPFSPLPDFVAIEIGREAATMVMLLAVGYLAGYKLGGRVGAFALAFGVWDITYYIFLAVTTGWPASPLANDVLFLLPLPWWGPVIAPILLALLIAIAGAAAMAREAGAGLNVPSRIEAATILGGTALCLTAFMADALLALPQGIQATYYVRPGPFPWPLFAAGLLAGGVGLFRYITRPIYI